MIRRTITGAPVMLALSAPAAPGAMILFTPDEVTIEPAVDPTVFTLEMSVESRGAPNLDAIDVIVGSDDLAITNFEWADFTRFFENSDPDTSVYQSGWRFGFFGPAMTPQGLLLGTLSVDAGNVPPGDYTVLVDADRDGGRSKITGWEAFNQLYGLATVHVVPEPATITLLALGMFVVKRPRLRAGSGQRRRMGLKGYWS